MPDQSPAETLTAAAQALRDAATAATPGPWRHADTHLGQFGYTATVLTDRESLTDTDLVAWLPSMSQTPWDEERKVWPTSAYIARVHPGVGLALAAWLAQAARTHRAAESAARRVWREDGDDHSRAEFIAARTDQHALAVARQLLGEIA